jgi:hypothetical protein
MLGLDFFNDVPGAEDYDQMCSRARQIDAGSATVWVVGLDDLIHEQKTFRLPIPPPHRTT